MNQLEEAAVRYADRGWGVFPLYGIVDGRCECGTNCGSPGKHPRVARGLHDATVDEELIRSWWTRWPNANVGVVTGEPSGIYVIDIDNKRSVDLGNGILIPEGENSIREKSLQLGNFPETLTSQTGSGGMHIIFAYPITQHSTTDNVTFPNRAGILPSVDTRGDGGYIVAPPSLHQSGNRYRWVDSDGVQIAKLPSGWIRWLTETSQQPSKHSLDLEIGQDFSVREGEGRHDWLFRMGSKLRGQHGLPELALYGALAAYNASVCKPPLEQREVEHIVQSCIEYDPQINLDRLDNTSVPELLEAEDLAIKLIDFLNEEPEEFAPLVSHLLNSGEAMIIGGPPNVGKTWAVMDMMLGISSGTNFANHFHCSPGAVLFLDEEGSRRGDWERFQMLLAGRDESAAEYPIYSKIDSGIRLDDSRGIAALSRLIERYRPSAVFLDSLVRVHGGEESNNRAMAEFFRNVKRLMNVYDTSFVFTHHIRKPAREQVDDPIWMLRGASDIQGFPDSILVMLPGEDYSQLQAIHTKNRNGPKLPSFTLGLQILPDRGTARVAYRDEATASKVEQDAIREVLLLNTGLKTAETLSVATGIPIGTIKKRLTEMELAGAIRSQREANTRYFQIQMD